LITALTARHRLPAVYAQSYYVASGGLISYADSTTDPYWRPAGHVDRILKREKPADLSGSIKKMLEFGSSPSAIITRLNVLRST
jgi:ABC-type uncharacterized transport system substrate-binding protein